MASLLRQRLFGRRVHARGGPCQLRQRLQLHRRARQLFDRRLQACRSGVRRAAHVQPARTPVGARRLARGDTGRLLWHRDEHLERRPHQLPVPTTLRLSVPERVSRRAGCSTCAAGSSSPNGRRSPAKARFPSVETKYTPETLPGLGAKVTYLHTLGTIGFDSRTSPGYTRRGVFLGATHSRLSRQRQPVRFSDGGVRRHRPPADPAGNVGAVVPRPRPVGVRQGRPADTVLHAAVGRRRLVAARLQQLALPRQEQPADAGRVADHGQPLSRHGVLLRHRQGRRAPVGSRLRRSEGQLRVRRALPRPVRHAAAGRASREAAKATSPSRSRRQPHSRTDPMLNSTLSTRVRRAALVAASAGAVSLFSTGASTQAPRFYPDDPIAREPESRDASKAAPYEQSQMYELLYNLFVNAKHEPSGLRAKNINTIDEVAGLELVHQSHRHPADHDGRNHARPERRGAARSVEMGADPREDGRRASRLHRDRRAGRDLVPRVRSDLGARGRHRRRRDRTEDLLGARLQPGRVVPDDVRSEERHHRPEGDGAAPERQADAVHPRRHERHPRERPAQSRWHISGHRRPPAARQDPRRLPVFRHPSRRSQRHGAARASPRAARAARVRRLDEPHRLEGRQHRSTRSSPKTARRSSSTTCRTSARPSACATTTRSGT